MVQIGSPRENKYMDIKIKRLFAKYIKQSRDLEPLLKISLKWSIYSLN